MSTLTVYSDIADNCVEEDTGSAGYNFFAWNVGDTYQPAGQSYAQIAQYHNEPYWDWDLNDGMGGWADNWIFDGYADQYSGYELFISFDTSSIGSGTISTATLNMTIQEDRTGGSDFNIQARLHDWGTSVTTADWVAAASLSGKTLLAHKSTVGISNGSAYDFTNDALVANINKSGSTRMLLASDRFAAGTIPSGEEFVHLRTADYTGTTNDPKLVITYSTGGATTTTVFAQAQSRIKTINYSKAQVQAKIKSTAYLVGQSQSDIKKSYYGYSQSQSSIKSKSAYSAQASAWIRNTYTVFAQAGAAIKYVLSNHALAIGWIKDTILRRAQAQAYIILASFAYAQAGASILGPVAVQGQAVADVLASSQVAGLAQADILTTSAAYAQSRSAIVALSNRYAQARSSIMTIYLSEAQSVAYIMTTGYGYAQSQAYILAEYAGQAQSGAWIKSLSTREAQAQSRVRSTYQVVASAGSMVHYSDLAHYAQAAGSVRQTYLQGALALAKVLQVYSKQGNASSWIRNNYQSYAQATVHILSENQGFASAVADILHGYTQNSQSQAHIKVEGLIGHALAEALILKSAGYANALAIMGVPHTLEMMTSSVRVMDLVLSSRALTRMTDSTRPSIFLEVRDKALIGLSLSDKEV